MLMCHIEGRLQLHGILQMNADFFGPSENLEFFTFFGKNFLNFKTISKPSLELILA